MMSNWALIALHGGLERAQVLGLDGLERGGQRGQALRDVLQAAADDDQRGGQHGDDDDGQQHGQDDEQWVWLMRHRTRR